MPCRRTFPLPTSTHLPRTFRATSIFAQVRPAGDRVSIPFFINPDPSTVVECIPSCVTDGHPQRYSKITAGTFLAMRIDGITEPYVDRLEGPTQRANP